MIKRGQQIGEQVYILGAVKRKQLDTGTLKGFCRVHFFLRSGM